MIKEIMMFPPKILVQVKNHCPVSKYIHIYWGFFSEYKLLISCCWRDSMQAGMKRIALCPENNVLKRQYYPFFMDRQLRDRKCKQAG